MRRLLIIGCGDVALRALPLLLPHYRVYALLRNPARHGEWRARGAVPLAGDLDNRASLARIAGLADTVLHFAPPPGLGTTDTRTRNLLAALSLGSLPKRLIYISTSGVYGDCGGATVSETHPIHPQTARAQLRIDAERQIRAWAKRNRVAVSILRAPGIYAADRLPLERLRNATPAIIATEDSRTNHIHADDLARIAVAAMHHGRPNRVYHACDDSELKMGDYFDTVADAYGLPRPPRLPRAEVERSVSPALWSFMNESRQLLNRRMKTELRVDLRYPTVTAMLAGLPHKR
ncbi:MAG: NAD(P)-dependent oxidoreductase [Gallionellales bacterium GWA2_59_43]|nr:MAG: NAD(P)-dependent oxidoreductase [Gallionellales bacterium GWA2_59_43]